MLTVKCKKLHDTAIPFSYTRENDACMDMYAFDDIHLFPNDVAIIKTGIAIELPNGYEGIVRGRSGLASKGIHVHIGTIDETYRGDVGVIVTNHSNTAFHITKGMRIAQFTVKPVLHIKLEECEELSNTIRGADGYGSSGL